MADKTTRLGFLLSGTDKLSRVVSDAVKKSTDKLSSFERATSQIGKSMSQTGALITGAGVALGYGTLSLAKSASEYGDNMRKTSQAIGIGIEDWQKLTFAAKYYNVEQTELSGGLLKLTKQMSDAVNGSKTAGQVFKDLGINIKDSAGNLKAPNEVFEELSEIFSSVQNGTAKTALATELFGRTGSKMIPLLNAGKDGLKSMGEEAERIGFVMSEEAAKASEDFNDNNARLTDSLRGIKMVAGSVLMPTLNELIVKITGSISRIKEWMDNNPKLVRTIAKIVTGLAGLLIVVGSVTAIMGTAVFMFGKVAGVIRGVVKTVKLATAIVKLFNLQLLLCPVVAIIAGIVAVSTAVYLLIRNWDKVKEFFVRLWDRIKGVFLSVWQWIKKLFLNYHPLGLVIKHWETLKQFFIKLWSNIKQTFRASWEWIKNLFLNYHPLGLVIKHWDTLKQWFTDLWERIKIIFVEAWESIKNIFKAINPVNWIRGAWEGLGNFFSDLKERFKQWGMNLISGLQEGMKALAEKAAETARNIGKKIAGGFKRFLGINSPSKVFMEYGLNITEGLTSGMAKGADSIGNASQSLAMQTVEGVKRQQEGNSSPNHISNNGGSINLTYQPSITINGGTSRDGLQSFERLLREHKDQIISIIEKELQNRARLAY